MRHPEYTGPNPDVGPFQILLDCDGVLANFVGGALKELKKATGIYLKEQDITGPFHRVLDRSTWRDIQILVAQPSFCQNLNWYPDAKSFVNSCKQLGKVLVVTKPWFSYSWCFERDEWLYPYMDISNVVYTHHKEVVRGDVLVEDTAENIDAWLQANPGGTGILINRPWNRKDKCAGKRVGNLRDALKLIKRLEKDYYGRAK